MIYYRNEFYYSQKLPASCTSLSSTSSPSSHLRIAEEHLTQHAELRIAARYERIVPRAKDADLSGCRFDFSSHPDPQYVELTPHLVIGPTDFLGVSSSNSPDPKCYFDGPSCSCADLLGVSLFERFLASSPFALVLKKIAHFLYNLPTDAFKPNAICRIVVDVCNNAVECADADAQFFRFLYVLRHALVRRGFTPRGAPSAGPGPGPGQRQGPGPCRGPTPPSLGFVCVLVVEPRQRPRVRLLDLFDLGFALESLDDDEQRHVSMRGYDGLLKFFKLGRLDSLDLHGRTAAKCPVLGLKFIRSRFLLVEELNLPPEDAVLAGAEPGASAGLSSSTAALPPQPGLATCTAREVTRLAARALEWDDDRAEDEDVEPPPSSSASTVLGGTPSAGAIAASAQLARPSTSSASLGCSANFSGAQRSSPGARSNLDF